MLALAIGAQALPAESGKHHGSGSESTGSHSAHHVGSHSGRRSDGDGGDSGSSGVDMCVPNSGCFPRFYLLGAQKAGTTSIFQMLHDANLVCGATANNEHDYKYKESHFFDRSYKKDTAQYLQLYSKTSKCDGSNFMDATPNYLFDHDVPTRMAEFFQLMPAPMIPQLRMMAILREPISRDLSIYNMFKSQWEAEKVKTDMIDAGSVLRSLCKDGATGFPTYRDAVSCMVDEWHDKCLTDGVSHMDAYEKCAYDDNNLKGGRRNRLTDGMYAAQLHRHGKGLLRKHLLVLQFEAMLDDQPGYIAKMISFLGLPASPQLTEIPKDNTQAFPGKVESISCDTLKSLNGVFRSWNQMLYRRLSDQRAAGHVPSEEPEMQEFVEPTCTKLEAVYEGRGDTDGSSKGSKQATLAPAA